MESRPLGSRGTRSWLVWLCGMAVLLASCGAPASPTASDNAASSASSATSAASEAAPGTAATAAAEPTTLNITVWTNNEQQLTVLNEIGAAFAATRPGVSVAFTSIPAAEYDTKLTVQLAGGTPPDAGWIVESSSPTFIQSGVLADLGPVLREQADYNFPDFSPTALELWTRDDAVYGVPFSTSPFIVYYNADLFEQAGLETPRELAAKGEWTWDALAAAAKTISEQTPGVYGFVGKDAERAYTDRVWQTLIPQLRAYGTDLWNEAGECTLASPEAVTAISRYHQMIFADKSVVPPGEQADFFAGQAAMTINQLSRAVTLAEAPFAWDIAPLPAGPAGQPYIIGQAAFGAFNNSKNPELARDFVAFVTDPQNVRKLAQFYPPARVSVLDSGAIAEANPKIDPAAIDVAIVAGIKQGAVLPSHPEWSKIDLAARAELDNLWLPDADPAAVLPAVCEAITPLLQ